MIRKFLSLFEKPVYKHVYTLKISITRKQQFTGVKTNGFFYYHLYETKNGKRKVEYGSTFAMDYPEVTGQHFTDYHDIVLPWLNHRYVPNIPGYNDVDMIDVEKRLSE